MSDYEVSFPIESSAWNEVLLLNKYGDRYSIVVGQVGKAGLVYKKWCHVKLTRDDISEKPIPLGVPLGNREEAKKMLKELLNAIK